MKYLLYTIGVFAICLIQVSLFAALHGWMMHVDLLFILLFAYYVNRKNNLALYLLFISGVFYDLLTVSQVGITSANFLIALLGYIVLSRIFPVRRLWENVSLAAATIIFFTVTYITQNFLYGNGINGLIGILPWVLVNGILVILLAAIIPVIKPYNREAKIRID